MSEDQGSGDLLGRCKAFDHVAEVVGARAGKYYVRCSCGAEFESRIDDTRGWLLHRAGMLADFVRAEIAAAKPASELPTRLKNWADQLDRELKPVEAQHVRACEVMVREYLGGKPAGDLRERLSAAINFGWSDAELIADIENILADERVKTQQGNAPEHRIDSYRSGRLKCADELEAALRVQPDWSGMTWQDAATFLDGKLYDLRGRVAKIELETLRAGVQSVTERGLRELGEEIGAIAAAMEHGQRSVELIEIARRLREFGVTEREGK